MLADLYIYFGVAVAGLVSFLSPCVLPLVPPYLSYLGGTTMDQLTDEEGIDNAVWRRVVLASICFVLGFTTVFIGLGASASVMGQFIQTYKAALSNIAGLLIIVFGLHFLGVIQIPLLYREARYQSQASGASYLGAYLIGLAFAFGWTPCVGPILATVLAVAANEASLSAGVKLLLAYSLGLGIPFIMAAVAIRPFLSFMKRFRRHLGTMEKVMGLLLILTGLLFAGDLLAWVREPLLALAPALDNVRVWAGLALVIAGCWLALNSEAGGAKGGGVALLVVGMMLTGGSMNFMGQWLLENVPFLAQVEEYFTPHDLQGEIMRKGQ